MTSIRMTHTVIVRRQSRKLEGRVFWFQGSVFGLCLVYRGGVRRE